MSDTKPKELTVGSLFSGIGGLDLGLERAGMRVLWQCEADPYCRAVLKHHWPDIPCYPDVRELRRSGTVLPVDLICGGFPCQPVSDAGQRKAQEDPRWLWPQFQRIIGEFRPQWVLAENVGGLANRGLADVLSGLASLGFDAEWDIVPASSVGAHHRRERLFIVAYHQGLGLEERWLPSVRERRGLSDSSGSGGGSFGSSQQEDQGGLGLADPNGAGQQDAEGSAGSEEGRRTIFGADHAQSWSYEWPPEPALGRVVNGFPGIVDELKALGNSVVPQVAEAVGRMILASL